MRDRYIATARIDWHGLGREAEDGEALEVGTSFGRCGFQGIRPEEAADLLNYMGEGTQGLAGEPLLFSARLLRVGPEGFKPATPGLTYGVGATAEAAYLYGFGTYGEIRLSPQVSVTAWLSEALPTWEVVEALTNLHRVASAYCLLAQGTLLIHSSGLLIDGLAHIFIGHSGAGKSTLARRALEAGHEVLSDDLNILWVRGNRLEALASPFAGELRDRAKPKTPRPVAGLYVLEKGEVQALSPVSKGRMFQRMLVNTPFINADPYRNLQLEAPLSAMLARVPLHGLRVSLREDPWHLLKAVAAQCHSMPLN